MEGKGKGIASMNNYLSEHKEENDREFRPHREAELTSVRAVGIKLCNVNLERDSKTRIWKVLKA